MTATPPSSREREPASTPGRPRPHEHRAAITPTPPPWLTPIAAASVFAAAAIYFLLYRSYGFQVEDEGTLYFQLARWVSGQRPYFDFHTGYTPGFFATFGRILDAVAFDLAAMRTALAMLNAATACGLYVIAARVVGPFLAVIAPLVWTAFLPVRPGDFASFNVPYPVWPATAAWIATALCMTGWAARGGSLRLLIAGAAASFAFANKINAGAFALAACVWAVCLFANDRRMIDRVAMSVAGIGMLAGVWFSLGLVVATVDAIVHVLPCLAVTMVVLTIGRASLTTTLHGGATAALLWLAAGFVPCTAVWAVPALARLGIEGFAREVLLIGSGAAGLYYVDHPTPQTYAVVTTLAAIGAAVTSRLLARGHLPVRYVAAAAIAALAATALAATQFAVAPEGFRRSVAWQLENASFWLSPLANIGGITLLALRLARPRARAPERALAALVPLAVAMYVQLFPRSDFMHLINSVPLTLVVAVALLARVIDWFEPADERPASIAPALLRTGVVAAVMGVLMIRFGLNLEPLAKVATGADARQWAVQTDRIAIWVEAGASDDLVAFGRTVDYVAAHTQPGETAVQFPAVAGALYGASLHSPVPHDYWYPGRPDRHDEAAMLATIREAPPRYIVTLNDGWTFFIGSAQYFADAEDFARRNYALAARFGRFDVLARNDVARGAVEEWIPTGPSAAMIEPEVAPRRQAARRWCAGLKAADAREAQLPAERAKAILFLRALRDGGDMRAAGWLLAGYFSGDERLRSEAVGAMDVVERVFTAARHRWAGDFRAASLRPFLEPHADRARDLLEHGDPRAHPFASAIVSITNPGLARRPIVHPPPRSALPGTRAAPAGVERGGRGT
ncbi:MAG TPA: hypothetical protein VEC57_14030 [Candidatus Limnocylindrales bacterium]|nr:hypothetical protein [Candidatus Limnocylindrales bacterium]